MTDQAAKAIGGRIRALLGMTDDNANGHNARIVAEFARAMGSSTDAVYKMVRGETVTRWVTLAAVARHLGTTPDYLLGFSAEAPPYLVAVLETALKRFSHRDDDECRLLAKVLLEAARMPPDPSVSASPEDQARIRAAAVISVVLPPKAL